MLLTFLQIGPYYTRIGVVQFTETPYLEIAFGDHSNTQSALKAIQNIRYQHGSTNIGRAIDFTIKQVFGAARKKNFSNYLLKRTFPIMSRNSRTCCCCGIKTEAKVVAAFCVIISISGIINGFLGLAMRNGGTSKNIFSAYFVSGVLDLIFTSLAIHGIRKNLHWLLLPILIGTGLGLLGILVLIIVLAAGWSHIIRANSGDMDEANVALFFVTLTFVLLLQAYFFSVFYRCFKYIKEEAPGNQN